MTKKRSYHDDWDSYVENWESYASKEPTNKGRNNLLYPGDEWGDKKNWDRIINTYLRPYLPDNSTGIAVEIGSGSGKYTLGVIDCVSKILCFDVSRKFIEIARSRLREHVDKGIVIFEFMDLLNCYEIRDSLMKKGLLGKVDLFFSIDSMVHVELHTLFAYFINAAFCLKVGGALVMTIASCANDKGYERLLSEMPWCYGGMRPSHQFYFLSKDIICFILEKLGFKFVSHEEDRDILFVARKKKECDTIIREVDIGTVDLVKEVTRYDSKLGLKIGPDPFISIVVCTFHRIDHLKKCIKGVLTNNYDKYEIIIVDQGKNDTTRDMINNEFLNESKIKYIHSSIVGLSHARNIGLRNAKGEIIVFIDDDAVPDPGWLEAYVKVFTENEPNPVMVGGKIEPAWEIAKPKWYPEERQFILGIYDIGDNIKPFPETDLPVGANFAILRSVLENFGGFDDRVGFNEERENSMIAGEDSLIGLRVRKAGYPIYYQPDAKVAHYISAEKLSRKYFLRRHFWEGKTHVILEDCRNIVNRKRLLNLSLWHCKNILKEGIKLIASLAFFMTNSSSEFMLRLSMLAYSAGVCLKSIEMIFEKKNSTNNGLIDADRC